MNFVPSTYVLLPRLPHPTRAVLSVSRLHRAAPARRSRRLLWHCCAAGPTSPPPPSASSASARRRKHIGVPKNVELEPERQLRADETPWEDYLIPTLRGNSTPASPERYARPFTVLGVETSCDDTAAAVVRSDGTVLGEARQGQAAATAEWGGVVPHVARDLHERKIDSVIAAAIADAGVSHSDIDAVAATMGPGLEVCLRVGYRAAREVAKQLNADFVAVNHLEAHLLVPRMQTTVPFPFVSLLLSGGHCQLLVVRGIAEYDLLGGTLDDALGEAYDKVARMLGLSEGGASLELLARDGNPHAVPFPVPMVRKANCNFSFAGLKTCVRLAIERCGGPETVRADRQLAADIAASFQETAIRHLEQRLRRALEQLDNEEQPMNRTLVVSGGVAANEAVRERLMAMCDSCGWQLVVPPMRLCTDNGIMVAWTGIERLKEGIADDYTNLDVRARWPLAKYIPK